MYVLRLFLLNTPHQSVSIHTSSRATVDDSRCIVVELRYSIFAKSEMRLHFESFLLVSVKTLGAYKMNSERRVSPLNPRLNRFIQETQAELFLLIDKWRFLKSGHKLVIPRPNKTDICYKGVAFSGTVRDVFWGILLILTSSYGASSLSRKHEISQKSAIYQRMMPSMILAICSAEWLSGFMTEWLKRTAYCEGMG